MRKSKSLLKTVLLAAALGLFSTFAFAEGGLPDIENVCAKLKETSAAIASNQPADKVGALAKEAKDLTKDIIVSDSITIARTKATAGIKEAITAIKAGDMQKADELLKKAEQDFQALKKML